MPRSSRAHHLPPPRRPLVRVQCTNCGRTWGVYEGGTPRMWTRLGDALYCDTHLCNAELDRVRAERRAKAGGTRRCE